MSKQDHVKPSSSGSISIVGAVSRSNLNTGTSSSQVVSAPVAPSAPQQSEAVEALRQIQAALSDLSGPLSKTAAASAAAAVDTASSADPDKNMVEEALNIALAIAKKSADFADVVEKLAPHFRTVGDWIGKSWDILRS